MTEREEMVEVVHYFDNINRTESKGTAEQYDQWCQYMGHYPYSKPTINTSKL